MFRVQVDGPGEVLQCLAGPAQIDAGAGSPEIDVGLQREYLDEIIEVLECILVPALVQHGEPPAHESGAVAGFDCQGGVEVVAGPLPGIQVAVSHPPGGRGTGLSRGQARWPW